MNKIKFMMAILINLLIILPARTNLANEEFRTDSDYLEGIEQRNISDLENLTQEGYNDNQIIEDSSPNNNLNLQIEKENSNFLNSNPGEDKTEKLNSNHGDKTPIGGSIPFLDFWLVIAVINLDHY